MQRTVSMTDRDDQGSTERAAATGRSLQAYMQCLLVREAQAPTKDELVARMRRNASVDLTGVDVKSYIDEERRR